MGCNLRREEIFGENEPLVDFFEDKLGAGGRGGEREDMGECRFEFLKFFPQD